ncbi:hypothetical protein LEN26_012492, partial [Aphanomyces euteiches]
MTQMLFGPSTADCKEINDHISHFRIYLVEVKSKHEGRCHHRLLRHGPCRVLQRPKRRYQHGRSHPSLQSQTCTSSGCTTENTKIVLDTNWRWTHNVGGSTNCYTGNKWDATLCPDPATCSKNCALDGADYSGTYGITTSGNTVSLKLVTKGPYSTNVGSRIYLLQDDNKYKIFKLLNKEFTFDADASQLPC